MTTTTFKHLGISDSILQVCKEEKFIHPTEIQEKSIPYVIKGKDVIAQAATGSGKTLAFASGIIQKTVRGKGIQALVVTPTRELAHQVADMITSLSKYKPLRISSIYGGVSINPQFRELSKADIVIGTPGRLIDHIERGTINLRHIKILVLDECDRLLDMGFLPDVEKIISHLPKNRQTLLYSATISYDVSQIAQKYMTNPIEVGAKSFVDPRKLHQYYYGPVSNSLKFSLLVHLLNQHNGNGMSMIFCNTRRNADSVGKNLHLSGIKATVLHGGYSQQERSKRLNGFHSRRVKILVATDVAARGLDIQGVSYIYNYDLPNNFKQYIHRIGRTARAGKSGKAITLVAQRDGENFFHLFRDNRTNIRKAAIPYIKKIPFKNSERSGSRVRKREFQNRKKDYSKPKFSRYSI
ncbi:MAG: DEAD/DEAH box helicase [Candidatus Heimdallarchaeota archaeon]|nr:MAG: DEAD/DEAH box helicase [Candidatus Heimdallarchaeota archaeon]